jgi:IS5 family transposase
MHNLADEALCDRWIENPYFQFFCGEELFQHRLVFDRSSLMRSRQSIGEEKLVALLQESLAVATRTETMHPKDLARVIIDTTAQPKAVMFPTDAKFINRAREIMVRLAKRHGVIVRQSYARVGKIALIKQAPALCPSVQACQQDITPASDLSRSGNPQHRPQDCQQ